MNVPPAIVGLNVGLAPLLIVPTSWLRAQEPPVPFPVPLVFWSWKVSGPRTVTVQVPSADGTAVTFEMVTDAPVLSPWCGDVIVMAPPEPVALVIVPPGTTNCKPAGVPAVIVMA